MKVLVLPGDGVGPELVKNTIRIVEALQNRLNWDLSFDYDDIGFTSLKKHGTTLRDEVIANAKSYEGIILGPISHAEFPPPEEEGEMFQLRFA